MAAGQSTDESDFRFHMAIATATKNGRFRAFLAHLGRPMIPRVKLNPLPNRDHIILAEHTEIAEAIFASDVDRARDAMRRHLLCGIQRYRAVTCRNATSALQG